MNPLAAAAERILIIKLGALGDIMLSFEAFHAIRAAHPNAHITLLTRRPFVALAAQMPWFDAVIEDLAPKFYQVPQVLRFRKILRRERFTRVYDLQTNDRSEFYFKMIGPARPEWCGIVKGCSHRRHDHRLDPVPAAERLLRFLESVAVPRAGAADSSWLTGDIAGFSLPARFLAIVPGCAPQHPHKRWSAAHYAELANALAARSLAVVALGTAVDLAAIEEIQALAPGVINLAGKTSIGQVAEICRQAQGVVGNDTGPTHVAGMVGAPTLVAMSGKSDPLRMLPRGPDVGWVQRETLAELPTKIVLEALRLRA
jgi:ADP-heptose:LPS heptosyltransferase